MQLNEGFFYFVEPYIETATSSDMGISFFGSKSFFLFVYLTYLGNASPSESNNHSHYIYCKLELEEFGDTIIDITTPHNSFHNTAEIVICQDNI